MRAHLTVEQRQLALRLKARGLSLREIGPQVSCSHQGVALIVRRAARRPVRAGGWVPGPGRLTLDGREEITLGLRAGESFTAIAARLGKAVSAVSREVAWPPTAAGRDTGHGGLISAPASRPGGPRLPSWPALSWRPRSPAGCTNGGHRCRSPAGCGSSSRAIHDQSKPETFYQTLYVQGRGELRRLASWPAACPPAGPRPPLPRPRWPRSGPIKDMVMISDRPAEAADRAVPGHREGDLIIGKDGKSAAGTLAERTTRYVMLLHLPQGRDAHLAGQAIRQAITALPAGLARTITWDQGIEMTYHADFTIATGVPVYFCDPHSPWQRGS